MIIAWFSCGATSAVACKLALQMYDDVRIFYIETNSGHSDNERFIKICQIEFANIEDPQTQLVMTGKLGINETR